ncbi:uncharacterized protein LOC143028134 isoform X2 [Oratosquilla oratoria]|uniref:uncharacterized protein LOC143028134 isoform X2 n=1 Tax=Oratosquilla oratoria TaxID=337810 RepID=UPI003F767236
MPCQLGPAGVWLGLGPLLFFLIWYLQGLAGIQLHHIEITGVELRQVEGKWRNLKSIFHHYKTTRRQVGGERRLSHDFTISCLQF